MADATSFWIFKQVVFTGEIEGRMTSMLTMALPSLPKVTLTPLSTENKAFLLFMDTPLKEFTALVAMEAMALVEMPIVPNLP